MKPTVETLTTPSGWTLKHINGWMKETWVAQAVGCTQPHQVRLLPIKRLINPIARQTCNRYRIEDVQAYVESVTHQPQAS